MSAQFLMKAGVASIALAVAMPASAQITASKISSSGNFLTLSSAGLSDGMTQVAALVGGTVYQNDRPFADIPAGSIYGGTFLAAGPSSGQPATLTFTNPTNYLSFLWGSPDTYNQFTVNYSGTSTGSMTYTPTTLNFGTTNGNQSFSQYVSFAADAGTLINSVTFNNVPAIDAFETANFSVSAAAVPEPATWGMMILGFGFMGMALRRRSAVKAKVSYS